MLGKYSLLDIIQESNPSAVIYLAQDTEIDEEKPEEVKPYLAIKVFKDIHQELSEFAKEYITSNMGVCH